MGHDFIILATTEFWEHYGYLGLFAGSFLSALFIPLGADLLYVSMLAMGFNPWLCLFDAATPESCRRRIEGYKARCPQFEAVYYTAAQAANLTENLRTTIAAYVSCDRKGRKSPPRSC